MLNQQNCSLSFCSGLFVFLLALVLSPQPAAAQDFHPWELNGGFAYQSLSAPGLPSRDDAVGGWGGLAYHLNRHFSLVAEFGYQKNPECAQNDIECIIGQLSQPLFVTYSGLQFLGGPRLSTRRDAALDFFGHFLLGLARTRTTVIDLNTLERTETKSGARFALGLGGGMDWNLADMFAVRVVQVDYLPVWHQGEVRHSIRVQAGIVIRFGGSP
jgi:hypothetical protein